MLRRTAIALLWFIAVLVAHELIWSMTGSPRLLGPTLGAIAAAFTFLDPYGQIHPSPRRPDMNEATERLSMKSGMTTR